LVVSGADVAVQCVRRPKVFDMPWGPFWWPCDANWTLRSLAFYFRVVTVMNERTHVGPREVAERLGLSVDHVLGLIRSGVLRASNVGVGRRPRWRVALVDLVAFLDQRANGGTAASAVVVASGRRVGRGRRRAVVSDEEFV
jgi:excisionase family DNA binding protein